MTAEVPTHLRLFTRVLHDALTTTACQLPLVGHIVVDAHPVVDRGQGAAGSASSLLPAAAAEAASPIVDGGVIHQVEQAGVVAGQGGGEGARLVSMGDSKVEVVVSVDLEGPRDGDLVETTSSKVPDSIRGTLRSVFL